MRKPALCTPIALAVISAFLVFVPAAMAANPGDVEFNPAPSTPLYVTSAPSIQWAEYGAIGSASCTLSKISLPTSTLFPTGLCTSGSHPPVVSSVSGGLGYLWNTSSMITTDGTYRVTYVANFSTFPQVTVNRDFVVDGTKPVITASAPLGVTTDNTPQVGYSVDDVNPDPDPGATLCAVDPVDPLDAGSYAVCPASPYSLPTLTDGEHKFWVVAYDLAQNLSVAVKNFTIDATGPAITITGLSEGEVLTTAWPSLSVSSTDAGTGVLNTTCAYDATAPTLCSDANFLNTPLPEGAHTLNVVASDVAGNVSRRVIHFTVDTTGGLTQGLVAPKAAKFAVKRGKLKGGKYPTTFTIIFALPVGAPTSGCSGSAKINIVVKKKQIGSASPKFKPTGGKCVATGTAKLASKFKGKKAKIGFAYKNGPIKAFTLYSTGKL
jgi:hypothetical protein